MILTNLQQKLLQTVKKIRTNRKICGIAFTFSWNHYTAFFGASFYSRKTAKNFQEDASLPRKRQRERKLCNYDCGDKL